MLGPEACARALWGPCLQGVYIPARENGIRDPNNDFKSTNKKGRAARKNIRGRLALVWGIISL